MYVHENFVRSPKRSDILEIFIFVKLITRKILHNLRKKNEKRPGIIQKNEIAIRYFLFGF